MEYYDMVRGSGCMRLSELMTLTIPILMKSHTWNVEDRILNVYNSKKEYLFDMLKRPMEVMHITDNGLKDTTTSKLKEKDPDKIAIGTYEFFEMIYEDLEKNDSNIPDELYAILGKENDRRKTNIIKDSRMDKAVCQGIARTLWEIYPSMTIEKMRIHKAIQVYGNGKQYKDDKTLRAWLSEVDIRENKRGRKKKINVASVIAE